MSGKQNAHDDSGFLSDESDFYGDAASKQDFENRARDFSSVYWWKNKKKSLTEMADTEMIDIDSQSATKLFNPYEGHRSGRQLGETVEEFLQRLPPSTTPSILTAGPEQGVPWIYIANPFLKSPAIPSQYKQFELANEGPPNEKSDWAQYVVRGGAMLAELANIRTQIEQERFGQAKGSITKAFSLQKEVIVQKLLDSAVEMHCTSGKWMLFCETHEVDAIWYTVANATASNKLGIAAKAAPRGYDDRQSRLICIYTKDFTDLNDVARVLSELRDLGLVSMRGKSIYYKCDAYTYLGLTSGNEYNIKASLYNSADILKAKDAGDEKRDGLHCKKNADGHWRGFG